jgi:integrase/recombinase XerD
MTETHLLRTRRALPLPEWPRVDRELWDAALRPGSLLEDCGARVGFATSSNQKVVKGYGTWLQWLSQQGLLDPDAQPGSRITRAVVGSYIRALWNQVSTGTLINLLEDLYSAARIMDPNLDWSWVRRVISRVRAQHTPTQVKYEKIVSATALLELGLELMRQADLGCNIKRRAVAYRDGLAIAILSTRPLRLKNLLGLELGRTFVRRIDTWWIDIPAEATKTKVPIDMPLPEELTPAVDEYLRDHRPVLCDRRGRWASPVGDALWVSVDGSPMRDRSTYQRIVEKTTAAFGHPVNPHLFRDCVATSVAVDDPNHFGIAARLLGHRNQATTERYYDQARSIDAIRRHQELVIGIREGTIQPGHSEEDEP